LLLKAIDKKKSGQELSRAEIKQIITGYVAGEIPDYQMAALLMAIYFRGLSEEETFRLTQEMMNSGKVLDLSFLPRLAVDKHSTGGVGDKTSLVLAPLIASVGIYVPMITGRSLGHTGGTLDKLESIPGFRTVLSAKAFVDQLEKLGAAITGQTEEFAPADRRIYALRDATRTVDSIPLITASILSKKLAEGAEGYVFDVKQGKGAFMRTLDEARVLAYSLVSISERMARKATALITAMDQPLGMTIGNAVEVIEAFETLKGRGASDVVELTVALGEEMLLMTGAVENKEDARLVLEDKLASGEALSKMTEIIKAQGGNKAAVDDYSLLPRPKAWKEIESPAEGYISEIDSYRLALVVNKLGAGRATANSPIDRSVGIVLKKKVGSYASLGEPLMEVLYNEIEPGPELVGMALASFAFSEEPPSIPPLVRERIAPQTSSD
jgi:pyrimidine-nucleoside phosphorylase